MNLLLDTHIVLWWLSDSNKLSKKSRSLISDVNNIIFVSVATGWEIAIKKSIGKLVAPDDFSQALQVNGFQPVSITLEHAELAGSLPRHHDDPFDRMIIAQNKIENLTLLSHNKHFKLYDIGLILN